MSYLNSIDLISSKTLLAKNTTRSNMTKISGSQMVASKRRDMENNSGNKSERSSLVV